HTAMQERMSQAMAGMSALEPSGDTPTLGEIRDKIERRYAVATGRRELASAGVEAKMVEIRRAAIDAKADDRLEEVKGATVGGRGPGGTAGAAAVRGGAGTPSLTKGSGGEEPAGKGSGG